MPWTGVGPVTSSVHADNKNGKDARHADLIEADAGVIAGGWRGLAHGAAHGLLHMQSVRFPNHLQHLRHPAARTESRTLHLLLLNALKMQLKNLLSP